MGVTIFSSKVYKSDLLWLVFVVCEMRCLTKADRKRGDKLRELGCIICLNVMGVHTPPAIHHIDGQTKKGCHDLTIPLCPNHHQIKANSNEVAPWVSLHGDGRAAFESAYGTERELLAQVDRLISAD